MDWYCLLHSIPGRIRIRVALQPDDLPFLGGYLQKQSSIEDIRINCDCRSLVIRYSETQTTESAVLQALDGFSLETQRQLGFEQPTTQESSESLWSLGMSTTAIVLGWMESSFAPLLLAGAALPIFSRAYDTVINKAKLNVDVLDAAATTVLCLQAQTQTAATMVWLVSLGDWVRDFTMRQSQRSIESLLAGVPQTAWVVQGRQKIRTPIEQVKKGDHIVVYPGEIIPVDGEVIRGRATIDQKILTGESVPVEKSAGEPVFAATVVREGKLYLKAAKVGRETAAANIVRLVQNAPVRETRIQNYAEEFADRLVPWSFIGAGLTYAMTRNLDTSASLLIVDYGTGIRVAAPTTILSSMTQAARRGIIVKGGRFFERLTQVDTIIFDKTGTLTMGLPEIVKIVSYGDVTEDEVLAIAAAAEARLTHPVAEAIVRTASQRGVAIPERRDSHYTIGLGIEAHVNDSVALVGCRRFMTLKEVSYGHAEAELAKADGLAVSPVFVAVDGTLIGLIQYADPVRAEAVQVLQTLRSLGIRDIRMLTGDHDSIAKRVATQLGISHYLADALPDQKVEYVRNLQKKGHVVAVVGDGINDSPALAEADVGIAVRGGAEVARETADIILLEGDLAKIPEVIEIARDGINLIQQNWNLILYPNSLAIGLSLFGLIGPVGATLISNGSAVAATVNGLRPLLWPGRSDQGMKESLNGDFHGRADDDVAQAPVVSLSGNCSTGLAGHHLQIALFLK